MHQLLVNPDGSEQIVYTIKDLPVRISTDHLRLFHDYTAACHWHDDFEMLIALDGEMDYFVNSKIVHIKKGDGIFVNARRLHYGYSEEKRDCLYRFIVFHPNLLGDLARVKEALAAFMEDTGPDYWYVSAASDTMLLFQRFYAAAEEDDPLHILFCSAALIDSLSAADGASFRNQYSSDWQILRRMTGYIQAHYDQVITLEKIAATGAVCRSRCCSLFRKRLGMSPMEYITRYRLDKACEMLRQGSSVTEAALTCGFHGSSYFSEVFRRTYQITPKMYQKQMKGPKQCSEK